ncbi:MAG: hypothetical protein CVU88_00040 [Firmicutes bacterium HGW-Firmicutes-13]|nr:MAG: hypothetical protein CVU88_00040 [Firmicutes bacterium HGW-Firmicutes-13]
MAVLQINVTPLGTEESSISSFVSEACKIARDKGLKFEVNPMSTVIEGHQSELFDVAQKMHEMPFQMGANRVITSITIDERTDKQTDMENMVEAVTQKLD